MKGKINLLYCLAMLFVASSCGSVNATEEKEQGKKVNVAQQAMAKAVPPDSAMFYSDVVNPKNCFILVSKPEYRLYVCEVVEGDTVRRMHYPVCVGQVKGQKQKKGDMRTPECTASNPFIITEIKDASKWCHDFGDGRGAILSYGNWFMRLKTPGFSGIGIHGSTNNESSVPGRGSEGCIRLRNDDLDDLKAKYAFVGMRVVVLPDEE